MKKATSVEQWNEIKETLRAALTEASFNTWISNLSLEKINNKELILGAANPFVKKWVESNCLKTILEAARSVMGTDPAITITVSKEKSRQHLKSTAADMLSTSNIELNEFPSTTKKKNVKKPPLFSQSQHKLDNFIVVKQNNFAYATIQQALISPGEYSPILIFADHGLGKTHLLHGACNSFSQENPEKKIICLTAQMFVQQCSASFMDNKVEQFRKRLNSADLLVIEDFHFMGQGKKVASQKELAGILEELKNNKKQVIISSNKALHEISGIDSMLASRVSAGLQIKIDPLDTQAREFIIARMQQHLSSDEIAELASRLAGDIREIEGAIKTIEAMNKFNKNNANQFNIIDSLAIARKKTAFSITDIIAAVSLEFNIPVSDIRGKKRNREIVKARRIAIHLSRHLTDVSLTDIGLEFGGRRHPTIINILKTEPAEATRLFRNKLDNLIHTLGADITVAEIMSSQKEIF